MKQVGFEHRVRAGDFSYDDESGESTEEDNVTYA